MHKSQYGILILPFIIAIILSIIIYLISLSDRIRARGGLKGKDKLKISIGLKITLAIVGLLFLFLFNWKLGFSVIFFGLAFIIHENWKNYGK